jgi:hypothetical protein
MLARGLGDWGGLASWLVASLVGWTLVVLGAWDFVESSTPTHLRDLCGRLSARVAGWVDLHASADPVSNGRLHDDERLGPESVQVVNAGSLLKDHTSYWANRDEFVTAVGNRLLVFDERAARLIVPDEVRAFLAVRRRARVRFIRACWWTAVVSSLALLVRYSADWSIVAGWAAREVSRWVPAAFGWEAARVPAPAELVWARSVGWMALVWITYGATRALWSLRRRLETARLMAAESDSGRDSALGVALTFQVVVAGLAVLPGVDAFWILTAALVGASTAAIASSSPRPPDVMRHAAAAGTDEPWSRADRSARRMWQVFLLVAWAVSMTVGVAGTIDSVRGWLASRFAPWEPHWLTAAVVSAAALFAVSLVLVALARVAGAAHRRVRRS